MVYPTYKVTHNSYTSAIQEMEVYAKRLGYELDEDQLATDIGMGPRKPKEGDYNKFHLRITKDGKELKKCLQVQIFGINNGKFELNMYVM